MSQNLSYLFYKYNITEIKNMSFLPYNENMVSIFFSLCFFNWNAVNILCQYVAYKKLQSNCGK